MSRVLIAGLLGAIAIFLWTAIAHMLTPLGSVGFHAMPNEAAVLSAMQSNIGDKPGFYFFPWVDPNDPAAMEKSAALEKVNPSGMLLYRPVGGMMGTDMGPMLAKEFAKQLIQALIAAYLVSLMVGLSFAQRWIAVVLIFVSSAIATNASYWIWYEYPLDYTLAQIVIELVSGVVAGAAIAFWLGRGKPA